MMLVQYKDENDFLCQSYVKNKSDEPTQGVLYNPPNLDTLNLNLDIQRKLNDALVHSGLITYQDVLDSGGGVTGVLNRLKLKHLRKQVITLYKIEK